MKLTFTILALSIGFITSAQNALTGTISNTDGEPIEGAEIYLPKIHKGVVSNTEGYYSIKNLPSGNIDIVVMSMGYETLSTVIEISEDTTYDFILKESVFKMDEVLISTPFNKLQSHNVMKVENMKISGSNLGAINLTEKLSNVPGITNISTGNGIGKPVIRGLSGNRVLVYTQGIRYENQQFGEKHGLGINESGIENVEIIKGPTSLLYGSDAMGGVIYLVPEKFESLNRTSMNFSSQYQTNTIGFTNSLGIKTTKDKLKFLVRGSLDTQSDYKTGDGIRVTNSRFNNKDLKAGLGYDTDFFSTDIRYNFNEALNGITHDIDEQTTSKAMDGVHQKITNHIISAKNNFYFKTFTLNSDIGFTHHNRNLYNGDVKNIDMNLNTLNYDIKAHLLNTGKVETIFGVQGMYQTNKNYGKAIFLPDATTVDLGIFTTMNYEIKGNTFQAGIRFDNRNISTEVYGNPGDDTYFESLDRNLNSITGAFGLKSDWSEQIISRINIALGFRAPNLSELTSNGLHAGRYEVGNSDLENEKNFQLDASLEYSNSSFEFFLNGFYNRIKNYIYLEPNGTVINNFDVYTYSQDDSKLYGGELGIHLHPSQLKWLHFQSTGEYVRGKIDMGEDLPRIPPFTQKNTIKVEFSLNDILKANYIEVNNKNVFAQTKVSDHEEESEAYTLFDLGIGSTLAMGKTKANIYININNLFDQNYIDHLSVLKEEAIANQGRNVIFGINFSI